MFSPCQHPPDGRNPEPVGIYCYYKTLVTNGIIPGQNHLPTGTALISIVCLLFVVAVAVAAAAVAVPISVRRWLQLPKKCCLLKLKHIGTHRFQHCNQTITTCLGHSSSYAYIHIYIICKHSCKGFIMFSMLYPSLSQPIGVITAEISLGIRQ